ncbi:hypothetical protein BKA70DRAFT_1277460 [Coprinopsis sp. MPI-PUGE-AT-0042]|nr:hypothetical protein BKA70DRAFT_1277460 [Coprinopsis sp. MPI-PUGE-AT-0042]
MPPLNTHSRREHLTANDKRNSPVTPAVTGIDYPFDDASTTDVDSRPRGHQSQFYTMANVAASNIGDVTDLPAGNPGLDEVWNSIRQDKSRKMAKEKPKVQSLEEVTQELLYIDQGPLPNAPIIESHNGSAPKSPRRQRSISNFRESQDGRSMVATFEMPPEVAKQDVHISFQRNRVVITWSYAEIIEWKENGVFNKERIEKYYNRTLPLPEGTRYEEIHAQMTNRGLIVRYPNSRCLRVDGGRNRSGES